MTGVFNGNAPFQLTTNHDKRFKSLPPAEMLPRLETLGGYIFVCNNDTMQEDLKRELFGTCFVGIPHRPSVITTYAGVSFVATIVFRRGRSNFAQCCRKFTLLTTLPLQFLALSGLWVTGLKYRMRREARKAHKHNHPSVLRVFSLILRIASMFGTPARTPVDSARGFPELRESPFFFNCFFELYSTPDAELVT